MKYGYARVSSENQSYDAQVDRLKSYGISEDCIRAEKVSGKSREGRNELQNLMSFLRAGDTLVCTKLDRIGRSVRDVENIVGELEEKGVGVVFTDQNIDTSNPTGKCFLQMLSVFSEFERNMIRTRVEEGRTRARENGVHLGRKSTINSKQVVALKKSGKSVSAICKELDIHRSSVYRLLETSTPKLRS